MQKYIVIEWIHGSWKTTIAKALATKLQSLWYNAQYYHFPDEADALGKVIRAVVADKDVVHHWQVTWALYAAFANRFHINTQDDDVIYVTDRHSVTTGLVFQKDIPSPVRKELYSIGIDALKANGIAYYIRVDKEVARERLQPRNNDLRTGWEVWKNKADDRFVAEKFDKLSAMYDKYLVNAVNDLWIPMHVIENNGTVEQCVNRIITYLSTEKNVI